jgi:hypothetical protein
MVRRSIPDAWEFADPQVILQARREGAAAALARILPSVEVSAVSLVPLLERVVAGANGSGRPLFGANRELGRFDDPVEALWQGCSCLREHRGDGHVAALTSAGLDGCEALVLCPASADISGTMFLEGRGWSIGEWDGARLRLVDRGLMEGDRISSAGRGIRASIEDLADELADPPFAALGSAECSMLFDGVGAVAEAVFSAGVIPLLRRGHPVPQSDRAPCTSGTLTNVALSTGVESGPDQAWTVPRVGRRRDPLSGGGARRPGGGRRPIFDRWAHRRAEGVTVGGEVGAITGRIPRTE